MTKSHFGRQNNKTMSEVYAIGEALYDIIFKDGQPKTAKVGGAILNTCVSLGKLGCNVSLISRIGNDKVGELILKFLQENGVKSNLISIGNNNSPIALAFLDKENNATYSFYKDKSEMEDIKKIELACNSVFVFGSSYALSQSNRKEISTWLSKAIHKECVVFYDPNIRLSVIEENELSLNFLKENISKSTIVRASDEDMRNAFGAKDHSSAYDIIKDLGCSNFIYTSSKEVWLHSGCNSKRYNVSPINTVSTIGAGDNFNAGIIFSLIKNRISTESLNTNIESFWDEAIETAINFAINVCCSYDNYINEKIVEKYKLI